MKKGFTLVELLVVITIIGLLSVIGMTLYSGVQGRARDAQRLDDAKKLVTALEQFKSGVGRYPATGTCTGWGSNCYSTRGTTWIPELDTTQFRNNALPQDPKNINTPELFYAYFTTGDDYCLQIPMENNSTGHAYYNGYWNSSWKLRFGPNGPSRGACQ